MVSVWRLECDLTRTSLTHFFLRTVLRFIRYFISCIRFCASVSTQRPVPITIYSHFIFPLFLEILLLLYADCLACVNFKLYGCGVYDKRWH